MSKATCLALGDEAKKESSLDLNQVISGGYRMVTIAPWKAQAGVVPRLRDADGYRIRAAGVCIKGDGPNREVLLVSAGKNHEKWSIPGGGVEKEESHQEAAIRELLEEAGVRAVAIECLGEFRDDSKFYKTTVFLMTVIEELETWEEGKYGRKRIWVPLLESETFLKNSHICYLQAVKSKSTGSV